jgi:hypothetical protein
VPLGTTADGEGIRVPDTERHVPRARAGPPGGRRDDDGSREARSTTRAASTFLQTKASPTFVQNVQTGYRRAHARCRRRWYCSCSCSRSCSRFPIGRATGMLRPRQCKWVYWARGAAGEKAAAVTAIPEEERQNTHPFGRPQRDADAPRQGGIGGNGGRGGRAGADLEQYAGDLRAPALWRVRPWLVRDLRLPRPCGGTRRPRATDELSTWNDYDANV